MTKTKNRTPETDDATPKVLQIRCGCEGGGKGPLLSDNLSPPLTCNPVYYLFNPVKEEDEWK